MYIFIEVLRFFFLFSCSTYFSGCAALWTDAVYIHIIYIYIYKHVYVYR